MNKTFIYWGDEKKPIGELSDETRVINGFTNDDDIQAAKLPREMKFSVGKITWTNQTKGIVEAAVGIARRYNAYIKRFHEKHDVGGALFATRMRDEEIKKMFDIYGYSYAEQALLMNEIKKKVHIHSFYED